MKLRDLDPETARGYGLTTNEYLIIREHGRR